MIVDIEKILDQKIGIKMFTDSKSLLDIITRSSYTTEKRLMIDKKAVRKAYDLFEISDDGFIRSHNSPADILTKIGESTLLRQIILTGKICLLVKQ